MSNNEILVSVVVPTYNVESFLPRAIESIQKQTHTNFELIIVIDGSPDNSANIADKYAASDKRIKVIRKANGGVSSARNAGMKTACGEFVCFVDPDDYVMPDYIEYMLALVTKNNADISLTTEMFGTFANNNQPDNDKIMILSPEEATLEILYYRIPIGCYGKLFRLEFINKNKIRFLEDLNVGEGFNFNTTAFQCANMIVTGRRKTYFYYRENASSAMTKFDTMKCENGILAIKKIRKNLLIRSKKLYRAVDFADYHTHADFFRWMNDANVASKYPEMYYKCRNTARRKAFSAFLCPVSSHEKLRALLMMMPPKFLTKIVEYRKKGRHGKVR